MPSASVSKRVFEENLSHQNEFDLHENEHVSGADFRMTGFARKLVLTQENATRKWFFTVDCGYGFCLNGSHSAKKNFDFSEVKLF